MINLEARYQFTQSGLDWSGPLKLWKALSRMKNRLSHYGGPYRIKRPGEKQWGPEKSLFQVMNILAWNLPRNTEEGEVWKVQSRSNAGNPGPSFAIKKIFIGIPYGNPSFDISDGQPDIQRVAKASAGFDQGVRCNGLMVKKQVAGTSTWSQHSPWPRWGCKSNAIDMYFPLPLPVGNDLSRQRKLVAYLLQYVDELNIDMIISEKTYWAREYNFEPRSYGGVPHVSHCHVQCTPYQTGSPC